MGTLRRSDRCRRGAGTIMANRRIAMRKIRQVLRLAAETDMSRRNIARSLDLSRDTVSDS
jgi:DNA-binding transcriptional regulator LsrR (DeoR family)